MFTKIECGECGGFWHPTGEAYMYECGLCRRVVHVRDFTLDEGESFGHRDGVLGYRTASSIPVYGERPSGGAW